MTIPAAMHKTLELLPDAVVISDVDGGLRWASREVGHLLGHERLVARTVESFVHAADRGDARELLTLTSRGRATLRIRQADGIYRWCDVAARRWAETSDLVITIREVSSHVEQLEALEQAALRDPLTGLANRNLLEERLRTALDTAIRSRAVTTVFVADLDGFKAINDTLGHPFGDRVLCAVAEALRSAVRPSDAVCRWGGDEFVILCEGLDSEEATEEVRARLITALQEPVWTGDTWRGVTGTVGMAQASPPFTASVVPAIAESLLQQADLDMYAGRLASRRDRQRTAA